MFRSRVEPYCFQPNLPRFFWGPPRSTCRCGVPRLTRRLSSRRPRRWPNSNPNSKQTPTRTRFPTIEPQRVVGTRTSAGPAEPSVITPTRTELPSNRFGGTVRVITSEEIRQSNENTVSELLRRVPGVDVVQSGPARWIDLGVSARSQLAAYEGSAGWHSAERSKQRQPTFRLWQHAAGQCRAD
jgi:hypothetical protein